MLHSGDRIWVNIPHVGYVGVGIVTGDIQPANEAILDVDGVLHPMSSLELKGDYINPDADPEAQVWYRSNGSKQFPSSRRSKRLDSSATRIRFAARKLINGGLRLNG